MILTHTHTIWGAISEEEQEGADLEAYIKAIESRRYIHIMKSFIL
jgi:hypothetical protein